MLNAIIIAAALVLSPVIGGGFGELANGVLQTLIFCTILLSVFIKREHLPNRQSEIPAVWTRIYFVLVILAGITLSILKHWYTSYFGLMMWPVYIAFCFFIWIVISCRKRVVGAGILGIFLFICLISAFFGESVYFGIKQMLLWSACVGGYIAAAQILKNKKYAGAIIWSFILASMIVCVFGIRNYAISSGGGAAFWRALFSSGDHMRLFGPFINPGYFSGFLVIAIPVTLGVYLATRGKLPALLAGIALGIESIAIMLTGTKFGIVSALLALFVFIIFSILTKSIGRVQIIRIAAVAIIVLPLLIVFSRPLTSRVAEAEAGGSQVHSATFRTFTWKATANMIKNKPFAGVGTGLFEIAYPRYTIAGPTKYAHNSYLQIAAESGIPALAFFLAAGFLIAFSSIKELWKQRNVSIADENCITSGDDISLDNLIPANTWKVVSCAIFAALAGSAVRNVVDSDWYIGGIALSFSILAGFLASPEDSSNMPVSKSVRSAEIISLPIMIILSITFGIGDYITSSDIQPDNVYLAKQKYELASSISPLNPSYHRELAKYLSVDPDSQTESENEFKTAIELAPTYASNYYTRALAAQVWNKPNETVFYLNKSLKYNPKSTQVLLMLANTYQQMNDIDNAETALKRLISIENTPYEQVKGTPEIVDTSFAFAHGYFADKYFAQKKYPQAAKEYEAVIDRLNRWKSNPDILKVARYSGVLTKEDEQKCMDLLDKAQMRLAAIKK